MRQLLVGLVMLLIASSPAIATGAIICASKQGASITLQVGHVAVDSILDAAITNDNSIWSTNETHASTISVLQSFFNDERILVDFSDNNFEEIFARLRLFRVFEGEDQVIAGTLQITDVGAWAMICDSQ